MRRATSGTGRLAAEAARRRAAARRGNSRRPGHPAEPGSEAEAISPAHAAAPGRARQGGSGRENGVLFPLPALLPLGSAAPVAGRRIRRKGRLTPSPRCRPTHDPGRQSPWKMPSWGNRGAARCGATEAGSRRSDSPRTWKTLRVSHISHRLPSMAGSGKGSPALRNPGPRSVRRQPAPLPRADRPASETRTTAPAISTAAPRSLEPINPACPPGPGPRWLAAPIEPISCVVHGAPTSPSTIPHTEFLTLPGVAGRAGRTAAHAPCRSGARPALAGSGRRRRLVRGAAPPAGRGLAAAASPLPDHGDALRTRRARRGDARRDRARARPDAAAGPPTAPKGAGGAPRRSALRTPARLIRPARPSPARSPPGLFPTPSALGRYIPQTVIGGSADPSRR